MNCACGKSDGYYVAKINDKQAVLESKCCITTILCSIEMIEYSV